MGQDTRTVLRTIGKKASGFSGVSWSPTGTMIAAAASDGCVWVFPLPDGEPMLFDWHATQVRAVAFSPDSSRIASATEDGTVRVGALSIDRPVLFTGGTPAKLMRCAGRLMDADLPLHLTIKP